jgi:hypothetical protein
MTKTKKSESELNAQAIAALDNAKANRKPNSVAARREAKLSALLTSIAQQHLRIETLEERHLDSLDFHDCGVVSIRRALEAAYRAGLEKGSR